MSHGLGEVWDFLWLWTWKPQFTAPFLELKPLIESLEKNWLQIWSPKIALHPRIKTFLWKLWHCWDFAENRKVIVSLCYLLVAVWMIVFQFDGRWKRFRTIHDTDLRNFVFSGWLSEINEKQNNIYTYLVWRLLARGVHTGKKKKQILPYFANVALKCWITKIRYCNLHFLRYVR